MRRKGAMQIISAGDNGRGIIVVINFVVSSRECVNIKSVSVEKVGQFLRPVDVNSFGKAQFGTDLEQSLNYLERGETLIWIFKGCHKCLAFFRQPYL